MVKGALKTALDNSDANDFIKDLFKFVIEFI